MQIVIHKGDLLQVARATGCPEDTADYIGDITHESAFFAFDNGCMRIEGDRVTLSAYRDGRHVAVKTVSLSEMVREAQ